MSSSRLPHSPTEDTPTPDLRKEYTDKVSKDFSEAGEHMIDPIAYKQDDKQLREAIVLQVVEWIWADIPEETTELHNVKHDQWQKLYDRLEALFTTAQIQLLTELEGALNNHALANTVDKDNHAWLVRDVLEVLEHKKQELERKI